VIAQDVAVGKDAILDLANAGLKATNAMEA
jgi:hypothetical protein